MAVRTFGGTTAHIELAVGGLLGMDGGPMTIACLVDRTAAAAHGTMISTTTSAETGYIWKYQARTSGESNRQLFAYQASSFDVGTVTTGHAAADGWAILSWSKTSGSTSMLFGRYRLTAADFASETSGDPVADGATLAGTNIIYIGTEAEFDAEGFVGHIATIGVWNVAMNATQMQELNAVLSTQSWYTHSAGAPVALWDLNQASTATAVTDLTGNGADQTALTGTSVTVGSDPPGWTFGITPPEPDIQEGFVAPAGTFSPTLIEKGWWH